jgi:hypothetical protein
MANQTKTQRQAAGKKAAATRKRNAAKRSTAATKSSARQTARSAAGTARASKTTTKQAARATGRTLDAAAERMDAFGRQAQRMLLIQLGAADAARDALSHTVQTYTSFDRAVRELRQFERRGERVLRRGQQTVRRRRGGFEHDVRGARRDMERQANGWRSDVGDVIGRVKRIA